MSINKYFHKPHVFIHLLYTPPPFLPTIGWSDLIHYGLYFSYPSHAL